MVVAHAAPAPRTATGITEPEKDALLSASVAGTIATVARKRGEFVRQGELILELDSELEKLEVERRKLVADSKAELIAASNRLETLTLDLAATRRLFETSESVSREELQKKELEFKLAQSEFERYLIAEQREQVEYRMALAQLAKRRITAPFDGVIAELLLEEGENCSAQQPVARIVDTRQCYFITHIEGAAGWRLRAGMSVPLRLNEGGAIVERRGRVAYVAPVIDPSSGLQEVRVLFDNSDGKIRPGITGLMQGE